MQLPLESWLWRLSASPQGRHRGQGTHDGTRPDTRVPAARRTVVSGGVSVNSVKVVDPEAVLGQDDVLAGGLALIRKGRKNLAVLELSLSF